MKRRVFLKQVGSAAGVAALSGSSLLAIEHPAEKVAGLPRRALVGRSGPKLSVVGFPGLGLIHDEQDKCTAAVRSAFERGVNYFDVAPAYDNTRCETKLGIGLKGLKREDYFLACKTKQRSAQGAQRELENSLKLLQSDHFDLYQLHHLVRPSEVKEALGPGGALEAILKAKEQGKVKAIGFSAHTTKAALEVMRGFRFDTVMFPVNFVEIYTRGFGKEVLALAQEQGVSVLAIKPLSWGTWPKEGKRTREWWYRTVEEAKDIELAMRFTLSQPGVVAAVPTSFIDLFERTVEAAKSFQPLDAPAVEKLRAMAANRESIFLQEEKQVALNQPNWQAPYPLNPRGYA